MRNLFSSQTHSEEIMKRIENEEFVMEMFNFLKLSKFIYQLDKLSSSHNSRYAS